ncbi:uncharacterized protein CELE_K01D12.20 [Caenorhabditis elegans]|uniref:Uncharacterized protein n=1 Tax=Caenorhabditis elegans TaxID=6239 RepID=A0A2K5ATX7_CAEEL|nr:Uncharacterized protein CELE_K01D12.20 [Caenorhabditis elegans]SPC47963.1 Uncharacterized protein CELE_K01D12.20 [Caenorhabditis elegans]|eukprot:NP_001348774.1 Uncharacterized protein CELE_K01D12.20 [Caenorhabditis elegans]
MIIFCFSHDRNLTIQ